MALLPGCSVLSEGWGWGTYGLARVYKSNGMGVYCGGNGRLTTLFVIFIDFYSFTSHTFTVVRGDINVKRWHIYLQSHPISIYDTCFKYWTSDHFIKGISIRKSKFIQFRYIFSRLMCPKLWHLRHLNSRCWRNCKWQRMMCYVHSSARWSRCFYIYSCLACTVFVCVYALVCDHVCEMGRAGVFNITEKLLEWQVYRPILGFNTYQGSVETVCVVSS